MKPKISRFDNFWALHSKGYIILLNAEDFHDATRAAAQKHSKDDWTMFLISVSSFSRMSDASKHRKFEKDAVESIRKFFYANKDRIPQYEYDGEEARSVAKTFIDACTMSPASKGLFTLEEIYVNDAERWILREYHDQSLIERIACKKREAEKIVIYPEEISAVKGDSTNFSMCISGNWVRVCNEGIGWR